MNNIENFKQLLELTDKKQKKIFEIFQELESFMLDKSIDELRELMRENLQAMYWGVKHGIESTQLSPSGLSGTDSKKITDRYNSEKKVPFDRLFSKILSYAIAIMEENQRMGKIVACPTAGSCGIVPAVIIAYAEKFKFSDERQIDALITAGGIGKIVAQKVPLAGAVAGCQAECGVSSAMAAASLVELMDGNSKQIVNAAALALKNTLGLACDPVAGLVEVPCIKRNGFHAIHAVTASEMALAGVESAIPMDEIISAMRQIGYLMSPLVKESSEGGLAQTETALKIEKKLEKLWDV